MERTPSPTEDIVEKESSPATSPMITDISPDSSGLLNLSGQGISKINEKQIKPISHAITSVDVSSNKFTALDFLKAIPRCHRVIASKNLLRRLISLSPLKNVLEILDLSENQISSVEHYLSQFAKLKVLNLRNNYLHVFPSINELVNLEFLDISNNDFMMIPNLKRLANLKTLKINNNEVYSLKDAQQYLPDSLITFEIAGNKIIDLSEICYLKFFSRLVHFSFKNNPCLMKPYNTFNYRIFAVAKILSLLTVDDEEISDSERLAAEFIHTHKKVSSFYPDAGKHEALVKFLEEECPLNVADPLQILTPSHPNLSQIKHDYLNYKTEEEQPHQHPHDTPRKSVRSANRDIRRISPPTLKRSFTFDSHFPLATVPAMKPLSKYLNASNESISSNATVTVTESESINLNIALPVISVEEPEENTSSVQDENERLTPPFSPEIATSDDIDEEEVFLDPLTNASHNSSKDSPLVPRLGIQKGWTEIVRESPYKSVIGQDKASSVIEPASVDNPEEEIQQQNQETTYTLNRTLGSTEMLEKLQELKNESNAQNEEGWNQVLQSMKSITEQLETLQNRVKLLENTKNEPSKTLEAMQMFMPMPCNIQMTREPNTMNYTLSWDNVVAVQPVIRGYSVYVDGKFHSEVKSPVVRVRGPLVKGQKITLQSISATNVRSLPGEITINTESFEFDKENSSLPQGILTARSM